jgi:probable rRNA maturation factor
MISADEKAQLTRAYYAVLQDLQLEDWFEIDFSVVGKSTIRSLNLEHRNVDKVTDVLSFPSVNFTFPICMCDYTADINPETGKLFLGDIMICRSKVRAQAQEYGHSELREFVYLAVHGMLHLFGFDHVTPEQEEDMNAHQKAIMAALGIER